MRPIKSRDVAKVAEIVERAGGPEGEGRCPLRPHEGVAWLSDHRGLDQLRLLPLQTDRLGRKAHQHRQRSGAHQHGQNPKRPDSFFL